jgi:SAM-dependent methyltransferase/uncharacterized protein YbaR (Trm112 family)
MSQAEISGTHETDLSNNLARALVSGLLVCPESKGPLHERELGAPSSLVPRHGDSPPPIGRTSKLLVREDGAAYPTVDGIPILLVPELLAPWGSPRVFDLSQEKYAEAYEEMDHYNAIGAERAQDVRRSPLAAPLARAERAATLPGGTRFPSPGHLWLDAIYDAASQWEAYTYVKPLVGKRVLQLGGSGMHALKFLFAGASEAWLLSPMVGELNHAVRLAGRFGLRERFACAAGLAEELPFADESFDVVYAGGCAHHFVTSLAFPECARVLRPLGRFVAVEPWRAPFYGIGTRVFGKREPNVHCRPLTKSRVEPLLESFGQVEIVHHGTLSRYLLIALAKLGLSLGMMTNWKITRVDDAICSFARPFRRFGSSVTLLATK